MQHDRGFLNDNIFLTFVGVITDKMSLVTRLTGVKNTMISSKIKKLAGTATLAQHFEEAFGSPLEIMIKSPGRINIIGEHTDYNFGFVLPAAIDYYMLIGIAKNDVQEARLYAADYGQKVAIEIENISRGNNAWANLILGVASQLTDRIGGFDMAFGGNIPEGAGLSSSAALCCGIGMALSELFELNLEKWDIARLAQKAEHDYALVQCGIMDQFACLFGIPENVLLLDCKTHEFTASPIDLSGHRFMLLNSNVQHQLEESDYNVRKHESENALKLLQSQDNSPEDFRGLSMVELGKKKSLMPEKLWRRACHIVTENDRVLQVSEALKKGDHQIVGQLLTKGHESLRDDYEVTCKETDWIVEELNRLDAVLGARQVGGGFGGCVLALVRDENMSEMLSQITKKYQKEINKDIDEIAINIARGCHRTL